MIVSLQIETVYSAYRKKPIICGVSLALRPKQTIALIGPNGAGKSTLLKIVAGFLDASKGRVLLEGRDISGLAPHQRTQLGVGYLMQGGRVFQSLTVAENLELATFGLTRRKRSEYTEQVVRDFHLQGVLKTKAGMLSGGWMQLLAIAMVLVRRPGWLVLDEPAAGLSPLATQRLFETLDQYRHTHRAAILFAEQNVEAALLFAQRAVVLVNGRIAAETKHPIQWLKEGKINPLFWKDTLQGFSL